MKSVKKLPVILLILLLVLTACSKLTPPPSVAGSSSEPPPLPGVQAPAAVAEAPPEDTADHGTPLEGRYRSETDPNMVLTFAAGQFTFEIPFADLDMPELEGNFFVRGSYTHNVSSGTITFDLDEAGFENDIRAMVEQYLRDDPEMQEMLSELDLNPDMADLFEAIIAGAIDGMLSVVIDEVIAEMQGLVMTYESDFSKLYDQDGAWIRL